MNMQQRLEKVFADTLRTDRNLMVVSTFEPVDPFELAKKFLSDRGIVFKEREDNLTNDKTLEADGWTWIFLKN